MSMMVMVMNSIVHEGDVCWTWCFELFLDVVQFDRVKDAYMCRVHYRCTVMVRISQHESQEELAPAKSRRAGRLGCKCEAWDAGRSLL